MGMKLVGDIAYFAAIVGINGLLIFMLTLTRWRKSFVSITWTAFFFIVALILDLSATILFVHEWRPFILSYIRTPLYIFLALSIWTLLSASIGVAIAGARRRKREKMDVVPDEK